MAKYRNSPVIGDGGMLATKEELAELTRNAKEIFVRTTERPAVDLHDAEQVKAAVIEFFEECERIGKRPGNMGFYRAIGISRQQAHNIVTGRDKNTVSPTVRDIIKNTSLILADYREQLGLQGKINPVQLIFWQKNYDGLEDVTRLEVSPDSRQQADLTPEEIQKAIEQDIPVDVDGREI